MHSIGRDTSSTCDRTKVVISIPLLQASMKGWSLTVLPASVVGACPNDDNIVVILWLACHDPFEDNAEAAADLWEYSGAHLAASFVQPLVHYLGHANADVRSAAATALAAGLQVCLHILTVLHVAITARYAALLSSSSCQHM